MTKTLENAVVKHFTFLLPVATVNILHATCDNALEPFRIIKLLIKQINIRAEFDEIIQFSNNLDKSTAWPCVVCKNKSDFITLMYILMCYLCRYLPHKWARSLLPQVAAHWLCEAKTFCGCQPCQPCHQAIKPSSHRDGRSGGEARIISQVWTLLLASCANKYRRKKTTDDEKNHMNTKMISHAVNYSYIIGMHWCENFIMQVNFCTYSHNFMPRISDNWNHFDCADSLSRRVSGVRRVENTGGWWAIQTISKPLVKIAVASVVICIKINLN